MLISCFQCRQQLDVPEDSAGKRVRCPHCQYVIVVPTKSRPADTEEVQMPAMALPSMDLDTDTDKQPAATKIAAQPLPPLETPAAPSTKAESKSDPSMDELPPVPSIEMGRGRRKPMSPLPSSPLPWGKILGIGGAIGVVAILVIAGVFSSRNNMQRKQFQVNMQNQQFPVGPPQQVPNQNFLFKNPQQGQVVAPPVPWDKWITVHNAEHRFKAKFPGQPPQQNNQNINGTPMTVFEVGHFDWQYQIAHATLTEKQIQDQPIGNRLDNLRNHLNANHFGVQRDDFLMWLDVHPGREWEINVGNNGRYLFVRAYFVRDGNRYHQYLLMARGFVPNANFGNAKTGDVTRFFNEFSLLVNDGTIHEETDSMNLGGRRDNEFLSLALHPKEPIYAVGSVGSRLKIVRIDGALPKGQDQAVGRLEFAFQDGESIEQMAISPDGRALAVAVAGKIQYWRDWTVEAQPIKQETAGSRCAFNKANNLLVAKADAVTEWQTDPHKLLATLAIPDLTIKGFALSPDENTLAVFGDKTIQLWNWPDKKRLGSIDAHAGMITTVAFSPDSKTLASGSVDRTIKLWNVETRDVKATLREHAWTVWALAFAPDGKRLASGGLDGMLLVWDLDKDMPRLDWAQAHQFPVRAVAFDAEGKHCFMTCKHAPPLDPNGGGRRYVRQMRKIAVADMKSNPQEAARMVAERAGLHLPANMSQQFDMSPKAETIITGVDTIHQGLTLRIWDTATATLRYNQAMNHIAALSPDGKSAVFATTATQPPNYQLQFLDIANKQVIPGGMPITPNFPKVIFTPDSKAVWVLRKNLFVLYDLPTEANAKFVEKVTLTLKPANDARFLTIIPSLDRKTFLVELTSQNIVARQRKLYAAAGGKINGVERSAGEVLPLPKGAPVESSQFLMLRQSGNQIDRVDFLNQTSQAVGHQRTPMNQYAIHPEGKIAANSWSAVNAPAKVTLWDLQERKPILTLPEPRPDIVTTLRFSPDGGYLAMVTTDSWTRIVPTDWLLERKALLPCQPNEVAAP